VAAPRPRRPARGAAVSIRADQELAQAAVCRVGSELLTSSSAQSLKCSASFSDICPRADSKHLSKFGFRALVLCVSRATPRCAAMALLRVLASGAAAVAALRVGRPSTRLAGRPASTIATRFTSSLTRSTEQHTSSPVARSSEQRTHSTRSALPRRALLQATAAVSSAAAGAGVALAVPDFLADAPELRPPPGRPPNAPPSGPLANTPLGYQVGGGPRPEAEVREIDKKRYEAAAGAAPEKSASFLDGLPREAPPGSKGGR